MNHDYYVDCIAPLPDHNGPALVYKVSLEEDTINNRLDEIILSIKSGSIPETWFITPTAKPSNLINILSSKGFKDLSDPEKPDLGMALEFGTNPNWH
jgi:hypothetical protein